MGIGRGTMDDGQMKGDDMMVTDEDYATNYGWRVWGGRWIIFVIMVLYPLEA